MKKIFSILSCISMLYTQIYASEKNNTKKVSIEQSPVSLTAASNSSSVLAATSVSPAQNTAIENPNQSANNAKHAVTQHYLQSMKRVMFKQVGGQMPAWMDEQNHVLIPNVFPLDFPNQIGYETHICNGTHKHFFTRQEMAHIVSQNASCESHSAAQPNLAVIASAATASSSTQSAATNSQSKENN